MLPEVGTYCQSGVWARSDQEVSFEAFALAGPTDQPAPGNHAEHLSGGAHCYGHRAVALGVTVRHALVSPLAYLKLCATIAAYRSRSAPTSSPT